MVLEGLSRSFTHVRNVTCTFVGLVFSWPGVQRPPVIQCWEVRSDVSGVEEIILTMVAFNIVSGGVGGLSTAQTNKNKRMKVQITFCTWVLGFWAWLGVGLNSMSLSLFRLKRLRWL